MPMPRLISDSTLTCPECHFAEVLTMPADYCQWHHQCKRCGVLLRPLDGHCCVFCSFGSVPCPPVQAERLGIAAEGCRAKG